MKIGSDWAPFLCPSVWNLRVFEFQLEPFLQDRMVMGSEFWIGVKRSCKSLHQGFLIGCSAFAPAAMPCSPATLARRHKCWMQLVRPFTFESFSVLGDGVHTCTPWWLLVTIYYRHSIDSRTDGFQGPSLIFTVFFWQGLFWHILTYSNCPTVCIRCSVDILCCELQAWAGPCASSSAKGYLRHLDNERLKGEGSGAAHRQYRTLDMYIIYNCNLIILL